MAANIWASADSAGRLPGDPNYGMPKQTKTVKSSTVTPTIPVTPKLVTTTSSKAMPPPVAASISAYPQTLPTWETTTASKSMPPPVAASISAYPQQNIWASADSAGRLPGDPNFGMPKQTSNPVQANPVQANPANNSQGASNIPATSNATPLMTFDQFLQLYQKGVPQTQAMPQYTSQYQKDIQAQIDQLLALQKQGYNYDPATDQALQIAQNQSMNKVKQDMIASGRLYSSFTDTQQQQQAQNLIPQFQQLSDQRHNNQISNTAQSLSAIQGVENNDYNRYRNQVGDVNTANTNAYNQYNNAFSNAGNMYNANNQLGVQQAGLTGMYNGVSTLAKTTAESTAKYQQAALAQDKLNSDRNYNLQVGQQTGQMSAKTIIDQMTPSQIETYKAFANQNGGFATAINATNDPIQKAILNEFRNQYMQNNPNDPNVLKYANTQSADTMVPTLSGQQIQSELKQAGLTQAGIQLDNLIKRYNYDTVLPAQSAAAKVLLSQGEADLAAKLFTNQNSSEAFRAEMNKIAQSISESKTNQWATTKNAETNALNANTSALNAKTSASKTAESISVGNNVAILYGNFVSSGLKVEDWLKSKVKINNVEQNFTNASVMNNDELKAFISLAKDSGKFATGSNGTLTEEELKQQLLGTK